MRKIFSKKPNPNRGALLGLDLLILTRMECVYQGYSLGV